MPQASQTHSNLAGGERSAFASHPNDAGGLPALTRPSRQQLANALGWFSVGLGLTELLVPRGVARAIGAPENASLMRGLGVRELTTGLGILLGRNSDAWVQSRVAGDLIDLALLGASFRARRAEPAKLAAATVAVLGVTALDVFYSTRLARPPKLTFARSVAINRSADELYRFWRNVENLPQVLSHLESVKRLDDKRSHWIAKAPAGTTLEWDVMITQDEPGQRLAWRSVDDADVPNRGVLELRPLAAGRGTALKVSLEFEPPGGAIGAAFAKLFSAVPETQLASDLRRLKQLLETGEIATTEGQPSGRRTPLSRLLP
jgi:uncharacterized membrane protein